MKLKLLVLSVLLVLLVLCTGCIPILIHAGVESAAKEKAAYSAYLDTQAQINSDRQLAGFDPLPVLPREAWRQTLRPTTNSPSLKSPRDK